MATSDDRVPGPDHRAEIASASLEINKADNVALDEASGTPPFISAQIRSAIYIGMVIVDVLAFMVLGILPIFELLDVGKASQLGLVIVTGMNMLAIGLAVGYRPTRPGSPIG